MQLSGRRAEWPGTSGCPARMQEVIMHVNWYVMLIKHKVCMSIKHKVCMSIKHKVCDVQWNLTKLNGVNAILRKWPMFALYYFWPISPSPWL